MPLNADQLLAVFPHPVLTKIVGDLNLASIKLQQSEHNGNLASIKSNLGEVPIMLAMLEHNDCKVGLSHNLGEDRLWEHRQDLAGIELHRSIASDRIFRIGAACSWRDFLRKKKTGQVRQVGRLRKRESGLQVLGSLLGRGGAVRGAGRSGEQIWLPLGKPRWQ